MNSIKIYLLPILFLLSINQHLFSQNDFYNESKEPEKTTQNTTIVDIDLIDEYTTEQDYNELHQINNTPDNIESDYFDEDVVYDDEVYEDEIYMEQKNQKRRKNTVAGEIAADILLDVFINAVFIITSCWH